MTETPSSISSALAMDGKIVLGRPVVDDLQWLEATYGQDALNWARSATEESSRALQALPAFERILEEIKQVNQTVGQVAEVLVAGDHAFRLLKSGQHPKGLLQSRPVDAASVSHWSTLLDVGLWSSQQGKEFDLRWNAASISPDGKRCVLMLQEDGGDESELHEFDLVSGAFVQDGFQLPKSRTVCAWMDNDTVLVGHTANGAPRAPGGWAAEALVWRRGTPIKDARSVLRLAPTDSLFLPLYAGGEGRALIAHLVDYSTVKLHCVDVSGAMRTLEVPSTLKLAFGANHDFAFAQLSGPATLNGSTVAADSVVAVPLDEESRAIEVIYAAREQETVDAAFFFQTTRNAIALPVRSGLSLRVDLARLDQGSWKIECFAKAEPGVAPRVTSGGVGIDGFVLCREGFLVPPTQDWIPNGGARVTLAREPDAFDASLYSVERRQASSRDGEVIEFFLIGPIQKVAGLVPTLMTGYGTSGVSLSPGYMSSESGATYGGTSLQSWFDRGGALVVPALRGGGEHGAPWHHAGRREHKQHSYDDFHAVAETLISSGYTSTARLGVFGSSAGGLLAGVAGTQRPDLYGAVVVDTPALDMLRYPEMGIGPNLIDEFGDPSNPIAAEWLVKYSPYHNIHPGVAYPAFLVTIATTDNRVGPGHARKFAKRLNDTGVPALFLESEEGGHSVSDSLQRPDFMAMRTAFFVDRLIDRLS